MRTYRPPSRMERRVQRFRNWLYDLCGNDWFFLALFLAVVSVNVFWYQWGVRP